MNCAYCGYHITHCQCALPKTDTDTQIRTLQDRRDLLQLPIEKRREIMEAQAEGLKEYYETERENLFINQYQGE